MKKSKPPRIILRRKSAIRKAGDNQSPSSSIYDCDEKNVHVQSGFAFYKKDLEEIKKDEQERNKETLKQSQLTTKSSSIDDTILPGLADEIESYPCPICNDERVFMTRAGIQKHAENQHQDNYIEVMELAYQIQKEWERRRDTQIAYMDMNPANFAGIEPSLTCDHCNLLFLDEYGLNEHIFLNHNVTDSHSLQKHPNCSICEKSSNLNQINVQTLQLHHYQNGRAVNKISSSKQKRSLHQKVEIAAHVHCELCGLAMLRPSLLIRHMIRVHNRSTNFEANITYPSTSALAPLSYCVDRDGNLFWRCCDQEFQNREHLSIHRATYHSMDMEHQQEPIFAHAQSKTSSSATFVPPQQFTQSEYFSINQNTAQQQQDDGFALQ